MKIKYIYLYFIMAIIACSTSKELKVSGRYSESFSKPQIDTIRMSVDKKKKLTYMIIGPIVVDSSSKIGLYKYELFNRPMSVKAAHKLLKFQNKIVLFQNDTSMNMQNIDEFILQYQKKFSLEQIEKIKTDFLKGTEIIGRTL